MSTRSIQTLLAAALLSACAPAALADPSTAITYQGNLASQGSPVTSATDIKFSLFDAATGGNQLGSTVSQSAVAIDNGLFTSVLDFGVAPYVANGTTWVEISIRNPAGSGNYTTLGRQQLTAAPFSLATRGLNVEANGKVDIGVSGVGRLNVAGPVHIDIGQFPDPARPSLYFAGSTGGTTVGIGTYSYLGNGVNSFGMDFYTNSARQMSITQTGNVGIGTINPQQKLHVIGNILANNVSVPSSIRFKDTVSPMPDALENILKLRGVRFDWKAEYAAQRGFTHDLGFIAEEVEKVFPEVVFHGDDGLISGMDYSRLTAVTVEAIKQQEDKIHAQETELKKQAEENKALRERLDRLEAAMNAR